MSTTQTALIGAGTVLVLLVTAGAWMVTWTLGDYRGAHDISVRSRDGQAGTEEPHRAVVHLRALAGAPRGESPVPAHTASDVTHR